MHQNKYILNSNTPPTDIDTPSVDDNMNDNTNSNSTPSSVHALFITQPNSKKNNKLKPSKTLPPKSKKLIKHNHSKSDLTFNTTHHNTHMRGHSIDYLTAKSPRKNAIDFGDNNDIKTVSLIE